MIDMRQSTAKGDRSKRWRKGAVHTGRSRFRLLYHHWRPAVLIGECFPLRDLSDKPKLQ
jgi:hypothetical protein